MAETSINNPAGDAGRELTADVVALALSLPIVAQGGLPSVVVPFVFAVTLLLVTLFLFPLRDVPFVAQHATRGLSAFRTLVLFVGFANVFLGSYPAVDPFTFRWILAVATLASATMIVTIDIRRFLA